MTDETSLSIKLKNYLRTNFKISEHDKGYIYIDDTLLKGRSSGKKLFKTVLKGSRQALNDIDPSLLLLDDSDLISTLDDQIERVSSMLLNDIRDVERKKLIASAGEPPSKKIFMDLLPVTDINDTSGESIMVNKDSHRVSKFTEKAWLKLCPPKHVKACYELGLFGDFEYNPRSWDAFRDTQTEEGEDLRIYNTYIPPLHLTKRDLTKKLDDRFLKFFDSFFLSNECRQYAIDWIYQSLFQKIEPYLVLVGAGGTGKNLLVESVRMLHGHRNYSKAPASALDSNFNGHLLECTLNYYDECTFVSDNGRGNKRKNRLKEWANPAVSVETKGVNAKDMYIYCSSIISTNNESDVHIDQLDRKFSVLDITDERLIHRIGSEDTQFNWKYIHTDDFKHAFYNFLIENKSEKFDSHNEFRGNKFEKLVMTSLPNWQLELIENYIITKSNSHYSMSMLSENIGYFPRSVSKVDDFLKNFRYEGKELGRMVKVEGKNFVNVSEHFQPSEDTSNLSSLE